MNKSLRRTFGAFDLSQFISHVNSDNIVIWETLQNNTVWDCFKTPILREMLRIRNQHQEDSYAFWKAQEVGCARNRHQSHTVQHKLRLFLSMQVYACMEFPLLIFGT